jgi:tetratricopeptide (TPR) repeat protein
MAGWLRARPKAAVPEAARALREAAARPGGAPDAEPLAAALTLRYQALPLARARLLRMLTLAPGGQLDLRTASALAGSPAPEVAATLHALAECELLDEEEPGADGTPRYRVPGRFFAELAGLRGRLDRPGELQLARARLLERLVRLVESARALLDRAVAAPEPLPGPLRLRTAALAGQWLREERETLLAAAEQAIAAGDLDGSAGRLVGALLRTLPLADPQGLLPADADRLHHAVLALAERQGAARRAAAALLNLAELRAQAGQWEEAAEHYHAALGHTREPLDEAAAARALEGVAQCRRALGDPVRAADAYGRALALRRGLDDQPAQARLLTRIAEAHAAQQRREAAAREYRAALALLRRIGDERGIAAVTQALTALG